MFFKDGEKYRLPTDIIPKSYDLYIKTNMSLYENINFSQKSSTKITFSCLNPTKTVQLHSSDLQIDSITVTSTSDQTNLVDETSKWTVSKDDTEFLFVNLKNYCTPNEDYIMEINYTAPILDGLFGFYRSSYIDSIGTKH